MTTEQYNGWSNYETWCANLWLSNEYGVYQRVNWELKDVIDDCGMDYSRGADALESFVTGEVLAPDEGDSAIAEGVNGMAGDLLNASIGRIDWREIATSWMDELQEDDAA